jgi:hypothetical protein
MCCEGDSNPEYDYNNDPFVIFNIPFEKKELIYKIISSVKNIPYLSYTMCQDDKDKKLYLDIRTPFYSKERSNELFNNLYEGITSQNYTYEVDIKLQKIVTVLTTVNNNAYKLTAKGGYERYKNDEDYLLWVTPIEMCKSPLHRAYYSNPITLKPEDILARDVDYYDRKMTK